MMSILFVTDDMTSSNQQFPSNNYVVTGLLNGVLPVNPPESIELQPIFRNLQQL